MHVDIDAFYAAVEVKEQPELYGRPVVVGGTGNRGVVCSASYEARAFGVHSAMPTAHARRMCPNAVFLPPRFDRYQAYSQKLHHVFNQLTPLVEGIALDEAFLDLTGATALFGPPEDIGARVRHEVRQELGLTCSVGAGPNKLVAKLASKQAKPTASRRGVQPGEGIVIIAPAEVLGFLWPMPVDALWGVGRASEERLARLGVTTVGALAALPADAVVSALGKAAGGLAHELAWGRDDREVVPGRPLKSIGHEETYPTDVADRDELHRRLVVMSDSVAARVRHHGSLARTVTLKLRYDDFTTITRSHTFSSPQMTGPAIWDAAAALLAPLDLRRGVRLLGVTASGLVPASEDPGEQLRFDLAPPAGQAEAGDTGHGPAPSAPAGGDAGAAGHTDSGPIAWERASRAIDKVRERFGDGAVRPATTLSTAKRPSWPTKGS